MSELSFQSWVALSLVFFVLILGPYDCESLPEKDDIRYSEDFWFTSFILSMNGRDKSVTKEQDMFSSNNTCIPFSLNCVVERCGSNKSWS